MTQSPFAPIVLFVHKRPDHTERTLAALAANELAAESDLIVYSDAPKSDIDRLAVDRVRSFVRVAQGFASVRVVERETNLGLAESIIKGVTETLAVHNEVIVLEDDLVTSRYFLRYMNDAIKIYRHDVRVASIHGYCPPIKAKLPTTFFLRGADCWGWGTWRRAWEHFNADSRELLGKLEMRNLTCEFDFDGTYPYTQMLKDHAAGKNNSWAIRWHAATFLKEMLTLHPGKTFVQNIGLDGSGEHCGKMAAWETQVATEMAKVCKQAIQEDKVARAEFVKHFSETVNIGYSSTFRVILQTVKRLIGS